MPIAVRCPSCDFAFRVPDRQAGRKGKCPSCKAELIAPEPLESTGVQANEAFVDYFLDALSLLQAVPLPTEIPAAADPRISKESLIEARTEMADLREENVGVLQRWNETHVRRVNVETAVTLLDGGCRIKPQDYGLVSTNAADARAVLANVVDNERKVLAALEPFPAAAARRFGHAFALLQCEPVRKRVAGGPGRAENFPKPYALAAFLGARAIPACGRLMTSYQVTGRLLVAIGEGNNRKNMRFLEGCEKVCRKLTNDLAGLRTTLEAGPRGLMVDEDGEITLARHAIPRLPASDEFIETVQAANLAVDRLCDLYRHTLGRLAVAAEEVEKVLGLGPLDRNG